MTSNGHETQGAEGVEGREGVDSQARELGHRQDMSVLQQIIVRLTQEHGGGDKDLIKAELEVEMERAGLATGARKWIEDTASEISANRLVVVDAAHDVRGQDERGASDVRPEEALHPQEGGRG